MKKKIIPYLLCVVTFLILFPVTVSADMGPKPSIRISFENLGNKLCYGTLLSKYDSTGPSSAWDGGEGHIYLGEWPEFTAYEDSDGYYFLQKAWQVSETKELAWTYYPPSPFKILLYWPESGTFAVSGIYEAYAFDSYFTVDLSEFEDGGPESVLIAEKSYDYTWEVISLLCRIVITILLELGIALLFGFRHRKPFLIITGINVITQITLNVLLSLINYNRGSMAFTFYYILCEIVVFILEGIAYSFTLKRIYEGESHPWRYAFTANAVSFMAGLTLAHLIPGIF